MNNTTQVVRSRLALAVVAALTVAPAFAQDTAPAADTPAADIGTIVVTGTRKAGLSPTESISPIDVYSGEQLEQQAAVDLTDSITKIMPALNTQRFPIADGTAFIRPVSLRNLAPDQTLVLVNGTRRHRSALVNLQIAPLGTVNQGAQAVDFSAIPASAIQRVEVLRDGAAVLYGSDAIAGVVNVILKDSADGASVNIQYGEYSKGDGDRFKIDANAGFGLGENGFVNVSVEHDESEITSRGNARPDAAGIAAIVGSENVPYDGLGQRWGDPDIEADKLFINAGINLSDDIELYGFGSYMDNSTLSGFFYRRPYLPQSGFSARGTLVVDANEDLVPDNASQTLVNSIVAAGKNPADYLTASGSSPSGWILLNPIHTQFPGGYSPLFGADIKDHEVVFGLRGGESGNLRWDIHGRWASNELSYVLEGSINPSLGRLSPTTFRPGTLTQDESEFGVDFVQTFDSAPAVTLAYGGLWRNETYKIGQGDDASIAVGPTFAQFGVGSDGFQGFFPDSAGSFKADSYSAYIDLEGEMSDQWSGAVAVRYEDADGFDSSVVYKLSTRYAFSDTFAMRATYNTGFRTPTPGQQFTLNVTTTANSAGELVPSGTYPVSHPVAIALGAVPLTTEESNSFTVGFAWDPLSNVSVTLDYYSLKINDRIGLVPKTVTQATVNTLIAAGYPNAQLLLGSAANFFGNAFDSKVTGVDFVVNSRHELGNGNLNIDFRHNYNKQDVSAVKAGTLNAGNVYDLENQSPNHRSTLTFDYNQGPFNGLVRFNRYGDWDSTGGLFGPGDASDAANYGGKILTDLEVSYQFNDTFKVAIGGDNVFNVRPDLEQDGTLRFLGVHYALTSPFGFNGAFWYVRFSADF